MNLTNSKKIIIIGSSGSGKSTLSLKLSSILKIPVIHLDKEFWNPNWIETAKDDWIEKQFELTKGERWIIDGNYGGTMDIRIQKADTIIFLDINKWVCIFSVIKRFLWNIGKTRPDMGFGCIEKIDIPFLKFIYNYPKRSKPSAIERINNTDNKTVIILKSRKQAKKFLKSISLEA